MKKVSILMPTYNDCDYICETLDSVMKQTYSNWELLICDDGSVDDTRQVVEKYKRNKDKKDRIRYFYQDNADQLNALIRLIPEITGDYVYILHSDDLFYDCDVLGKMVDYMEKHPDTDSIIGDIAIINKNSDLISVTKVSKYINSSRIIPLQLLWLGRNLYVDMAFHRKKIFIENVYNNYLLWNGPFWLNIDTNDMLNVKNVEFPFFKYRVSDDNYLSNEGASLNVINGEIRVVSRLLKNYFIPLYKLQYMFYRVFNKLGVGIKYPLIYKKKESKNKYEIIKFVLNKRFSDVEIKNNIFLNSLVSFYKSNIKRTIKVNNINDDTVWYYGKDMRLFNKKILDNSIDKLYKNILKEMEIGFSEIIIDNKKYYERVVDLTKFLCIYPYVDVIVKEEKK